MSISHMPKPSSIMQGLPHHLQSSLVQNNMFGMDNAHRNLDEPNPDMLLALLARNKALEGELLFFFIHFMLDLDTRELLEVTSILKQILMILTEMPPVKFINKIPSSIGLKRI